MNIVVINIWNGQLNRGAETWSQQLVQQALGTGISAMLIGGGGTSTGGNMVVVPTPVQDNSGVPTLASRLKIYGRLDSYAYSVITFTVNALRRGLVDNADIVIPINGMWQILLLRLYRSLHQCRYRIVYVNHPGSEVSREISIASPDLVVLLKHDTRTHKLSQRIPRTVIPNGVSMGQYRVMDPPRRRTLLCVSALIPYKRVDWAIHVAKAGGVGLQVVGDGPLAAIVKEMGEQLMGSDFSIKVLPHEKMPLQFGLATALIHTASATENFPMVFLESLAANRPVLAFDTPTNREILGDAGVFAQDLDDMKRLVQTESVWSRINRLIQEGVPRNRAEHFDWSVILPRYIDEFRQLIGARH